MEYETFDLNITGAKEIKEALSAMSESLSNKTLTEFLNKEGKKFVTEPLKSKLNYSNETEKNIKVVKNSPLSVSAGVTTKGHKINWADRGTKERKTKKGANRGSVTPKNQVQPIIEESIPEMIKFTEDELANIIGKTLERKLKSVGRRLDKLK